MYSSPTAFIGSACISRTHIEARWVRSKGVVASVSVTCSRIEQLTALAVSGGFVPMMTNGRLPGRGRGTAGRQVAINSRRGWGQRRAGQGRHPGGQWGRIHHPNPDKGSRPGPMSYVIRLCVWRRFPRRRGRWPTRWWPGGGGPGAGSPPPFLGHTVFILPCPALPWCSSLIQD